MLFNMNMKEKMLEIRKRIKSRKPHYVRQDINKKKRITDTWRRPRGARSKVRLKLRGRRKYPETGYGAPIVVRNLSPDGKVISLVRNVSELENLNPIKDAVIIAKVGMKKKLEIIKRCQDMKIKVLNISDLTGYIERAQKEREEAQKKSAERKQKREKGKEEKKVEKKEQQKEQMSEEEKKEKEKEEKDKVLTKRN